MAIFEKGTVLESTFDEPIVIESYIAGGGQGDVYVVRYGGEKKALKWYKNLGKNPRAFYENIERNVKAGTPDKAFLWPEAVTKKTDGSFGYIMNLRPEGYHELSEFILARDVKFPSFKAVVESCIQIVSAFRILHNRGYSYQDLNDGNFFINPKTAEVLICDNDNVAPNGTNMGVIGKPRYMAPEIVTGKGAVLPNTQTDRFSLAVILFILLCNNHPLEGRRCAMIPCMTPAMAEKLYGSDALFIYDKDNSDNAPVKNIHKNVIKRWQFMPDYIKSAFLKAFSQDAIKHPEKRLRELDWLKVLTRFKSDIVKCSCGNEVFISDAKDTICDNCGKMVAVKNVFKLPEYSVTISKGTWIYRCQLGVCNADEALSPIIHVLAKQDGNEVVYGWQNMTNNIVKAVTSKGEARQVAPQQVVPVKAGIKIYPTNETVIEIL